MTNETRLTAQRVELNIFAGALNDTGLFQTKSETWNGDETATTEVPIGLVVGRITSQTPIVATLDVDAITWQFGNVVKYKFAGTPDLSTVVPGYELVVTGSADSKNDGILRIIAVDDTEDTVDVINENRVDSSLDVASGATGTGNIYDEYEINRIQAYDDGATNGLETAIGILGQNIAVDDQVILNTDGTTETRAVYPVKTFTKGKFYESGLTGLDANAITDLKGASSNGILTF